MSIPNTDPQAASKPTLPTRWDRSAEKLRMLRAFCFYMRNGVEAAASDIETYLTGDDVGSDAVALMLTGKREIPHHVAEIAATRALEHYGAGDIWNLAQCDECDSRITLDDFDNGAVRKFLTPSSDRSAETYLTLCVSCAAEQEGGAR